MHTLATTFFNRASELADAPAVQFKEGRSPYQTLSWTQFSGLVKEIAYGLASIGIDRGSAAAIFSPTSHLWVAADIGIMSAGAASVPVYPTSSQSDVDYILNNSDSSVVFVANESLLKKVLAAREKLPQLKKIILMSQDTKKKTASESESAGELVITWNQLLESGRKLQQSQPKLIDDRVAQSKLEDPATVIYTSGTTGTPKGVLLTHSNIVSVLEDLIKLIPINKDDVYLSFLPLSHVFERVCGEFYWLHSGGTNAFAEGLETIAKNMAEVQPTMILVVPRVLDKIYSKVKSGIEGGSSKARKLINWALEIGTEVMRLQSHKEKPGPVLSMKYRLADRLVLRKLRSRIGSRLRLVVSGGAPATREVIEFFNAVGILTVEGYGLTETTAPASVNRPELIKPGTVGKNLPSVKVRTAEDGEILISGPTVFKGYLKNDEATREAFDGEWFKTGDIGTIDGDGYIRITDRKKDLIVNSSGKNIAPQRIEGILKSIPLVSQAIVFGDKRKTLVALLTLDEQAATELAREHGWPCDDYATLAECPQLNRYLRSEIDDRSHGLADYERVRKFGVLPQDLSVENGELTATLKVKRNVVAENYKDVINSLYREDLVRSGR
jgi:long-chain acyl-CoA synthetase